METIDSAELQIALVVDENTRLLGVITDGDLRRALLNGLTLDDKAEAVMTENPVTATPDMKLSAIEHLMHEHSLQQVPVLDDAGAVVSLALHGRFLPRERINNRVVLMVGGLGSRLGELTKRVPKPLLRIGDKPILEIILDSLISQGFYRFTLCVNYRAEMIDRYFGDGRRWGAQIEYLREDKRLGTCGALSLLDPAPTAPFIVMNGDILTRVDFAQMFEFHESHNDVATMAVRPYDIDVPFGVVHARDNRIESLEEKPTERFFVNAGVYVLDPECIELVPRNEYYDITTLFSTLIEQGKNVSSYVIDDYWLDIGRRNELDSAYAYYRAHTDSAGEDSE